MYGHGGGAAVMQPPAAAMDHVKDVLGNAAPGSTAERKVREKQQRLAYGNQLQQQMLEQQEAKKRERMERMGIAPGPPSPGAGAGAPPIMQPPQAAAPIMYSPPPAPPPPPAPQPYVPAYQPQPPAISSYSPGVPMPGMPPPMAAPYGAMPLPGVLAPPPAPPYPMQQGPGSPNAYSAPPPGMAGSFGAAPPAYNPYAAAPPPPPQPMYMPPPPPPPPAPAGPVGMGPPGLGGALPPQVAKAAERAQKDAYRLELEAQMRAKEERKRAEREASLNEARARQAAMAAKDYQAAMGRMGGGGGAPLRDPAGNMVSDLNAMRGFQQAREREQMMMMGAPPGAMGGMMGPPPGAFGPGGFGGPRPLMVGMPLPMMGGPGMDGGPMSPGGGGGLGMMGMGMGGPQGPPGGPGFEAMNPNFRFRSDNAYLTPAELDVKARQKMELQEALERQIAEKKYKKDMEKAARQDEMMREEMRLKAEQERLRNQYEQERNREQGKDTESKEDKVAAAWAKAKQESEEAKRNKFGGRRAAGLRASQELAEMSQANEAGGTVGAASAPLHDSAVMQVPVQHLTMQAPPTPLVAEKVKQLAAQEIQKVRAELQHEAANLRSVVAEQSAQVAALKQHAERMEAQAENAQQKVMQMRVDLIRNSMAAPETLMHMLSDYPMQPQRPPPPNMLDIALDLPPPAAVQRRTLPPQPAFDMGPLLPPMHNPKEADAQLQRDFMATPGKEQRPPTQGLRTINPLESSLAAESVFIYPNGREMPRQALQQQPGYHPAAQVRSISAATHAASDLPFKSLAMSAGALTSIAESQGRDLLSGSLGAVSPGGKLQQSSVLLDEARVQAALGGAGGSPRSSSVNASMGGLGAALNGGAAVPIRHVDGETLNSGPLPPGTADAVRRLESQLRQEAAAAAAAAATAQTPLDVETLMQQNKDKLTLLQELTALTATDNSEAIEDFLTKFSRSGPGQMERTRSPAGVRVNTPTHSTKVGSSGTYSVGTYHSSFPTQQQQHPRASPSRPPLAPSGHSAPVSASQLGSPTAAGPLEGRASSNSHASPSGAGVPPRSPILFTNNNTSASPSVAGSRPASGSKPHTPVVGDFLDPQALAARDMQALQRPASFGRRAGSAGAQQPPAAPQQGSKPPSPFTDGAGAGLTRRFSKLGNGGEDTLDQEMRKGLGSRPASGSAAAAADARPGSGAALPGALAGMPLPRAPSGSLSRQGSAGRQF